MTTTTDSPNHTEDHTRYSHGGDEWIVVQLAEAMSLRANLRAQAITRRLGEEKLAGVVEICPSNASYMIRIDPDVLDPRAAVEHLRELEAEVGDALDFTLQTRVVDVPVLFQDEWTHAALMRFRDRHQTPDRTDIEFAAEINGYDDTQSFIDAMTAAPFIISMIGFVPSVPWGYQLVPSAKQIEVPKYVLPRTFTPERAFGWGGAFSAIYPVDGAGGYQLFGICPGPVVDPTQTLYDFRDSYAFPRAGDIFKYRQIDRAEYDEIRATVADGSFRYRTRDVEFRPNEWYEAPERTTDSLCEVLYSA